MCIVRIGKMGSQNTDEQTLQERMKTYTYYKRYSHIQTHAQSEILHILITSNRIQYKYKYPKQNDINKHNNKNKNEKNK